MNCYQKRTEISEGIKSKVVDITDDWGVEVIAVELKDILLPRQHEANYW